MKTFSIQVTDIEYDQLGINKSILSLSELIEIIAKKINKQTLERSIQLAEKYGLSEMTAEEINEEVGTYRNEQADS
ncbi:MAG: hypothetical protein Kapaf2KO_20820 [Candidatus Kapaibacteriales bacterium]